MGNKIIDIDFETRSKVDLRSVGAQVYAEHPSTEIILMAHKFEDALPKIFIPSKFLLPEVKKHFDQRLMHFEHIAGQVEEQGILVKAHNAGFEMAIYYHICHKRWGWPMIPLKNWRCSAAEAAELGLPRALDKLGKALDLDIKKDNNGHRLMMKMCKPRKPLKAEKIKWLRESGYPTPKGGYTKAHLIRAEFSMPTLWQENAEAIIGLGEYCITDVGTEHCASKVMRPLSASEQRLWFLDQTINLRGVPIDIDGATAAIEMVEEQETLLLKEVGGITGGVIKSTRQTAATKTWLATQGVELDNLQKGTVEDALSLVSGLRNMPEPARRVLEIRQSLSKSSVKKLNAMICRSGKDDRARGAHLFFGGRTGRFAGRGIQTQNLPRPKHSGLNLCIETIKERQFDLIPFLWGDPSEVAASCIRGMIAAPPGKDFVCGDFSSIECVDLAWLAEEEIILDAFRRKEDVYKLAAAAIYSVRYEDVNKTQRQIGKVATLALGYQGAVGAFQKMAIGYGVQVPDAVAKDIVDSWRAKHTRITAYWKKNEYAVKRAIRTGRPVDVGKVTWGTYGDYLFCRLPSGRLMAYYKPELREMRTPYGMNECITYMGVDSVTTQWVRIQTYGGKLVENIVQAVARDMLVEAMFRVEAARYPIVMHVHDEILSEVPEGFGSVEEFERIMAVRPLWAEDCPISAEGWRGKRYRK